MEQWIFWGIGILLVIGAVLILGAPPQVELPYKVEIATLEPTGGDEVIVIKNVGEEPVDLSGWRLHGAPSYDFTFPEGCLLAPGAKLRIHSGPMPRLGKPPRKGESVCRPNGDLLWTPLHVWCDRNGNTAYLYDAQGNLVDKYVWGAGYHESPFVPCDRAGEGERPAVERP